VACRRDKKVRRNGRKKENKLRVRKGLDKRERESERERAAPE
jgi:hypothetical protein